MTNTISSFDELALSGPIRKAISSMKYTQPTPIQGKAIPAVLAGKDIIGCAQTGTGKTAAFCVPMIEKLVSDKDSNALILVPTREIANQILQVIRSLTLFSQEIKSTLLIGGVPMGAQFKALKARPRIVVATPGRLMDHVRRQSIQLAKMNILVLDEADRMLDMGFAPDLNEILRHLPKARQTLMFSATVPPNIQKLGAKFLTNPQRIDAGGNSKPPAKLKQVTVETSEAGKINVLMDQLRERDGAVLIFARTKRRTDKLAKQLIASGFQVNRIHGDRTQAQRMSAIDGFRRGTFRVLVATDIAARGIDVPHIAHVINYDLPQCPEDYIHRIGRTARAGAEGQALSLLAPHERGQWKQISKLMAKTGQFR